jgi:6-phosphogluconolactonase (cycloisomerase 2 family)
MFKRSYLFLAALLCITFTVTAGAQSASTEILYVTERSSGNTSLYTYNVDPETAVATAVGSPLVVGALNVDAVTAGNQNFLYVWNGAQVWVYATDAQGAPLGQPVQNLVFNFAKPVTDFVVDPDGKFAYAVVRWYGENSDDVIALFTIDSTNGQLTNTQKAVAVYSNLYTQLTSFNFGMYGNRMLVGAFDSGPFTCDPGYDYYDVNQQTGNLGKLTNLMSVSSDCGGSSAAAASDKLVAAENTCCGFGSGYLQISSTSNPGLFLISCQAKDVGFCGDDANDMSFDPASLNLLFADQDAGQTYIGHLNVVEGSIVQSPSILSGSPSTYFSPDGLVLYALYPSVHKLTKTNIVINAFRPGTGHIIASTSLPVKGEAAVAAATVKE